MVFFDTHVHYQDEAFKEDIKQILDSTYNEGITKIVIPGWDEKSSGNAVKISTENDFCYAAVRSTSK